MEAIALLIGAAAMYAVMQQRVKELKKEVKEQINEYKTGFSNGYQTQNGLRPYDLHENAKMTLSRDPDAVIDDYFSEADEPQRDERWD